MGGCRALLGVLAALACGPILTGCDPAASASGSCVAQDVGERRCRAIVADAGSRLPAGRAPIVGTDVQMATPADRYTLREQQLVATVRFSFLDGSAAEIPVFCAPRLAETLVCKDPAR